MDFVSGIVVFILLWWWIFLMSLPFGIKTPDKIELSYEAIGNMVLTKRAKIELLGR